MIERLRNVLCLTRPTRDRSPTPRSTARLARALRRFRDLPIVGEIRQKGLMAAIDLWADPSHKRPFPERLRVGYWTCVRARSYGILARPLGDTLIINPPLVIRPTEIVRVVNGLFRAAKDVAMPRR